MDGLHTALLMFIIVSGGGIAGFVLKKLWSIDLKLVGICTIANDNSRKIGDIEEIIEGHLATPHCKEKTE